MKYHKILGIIYLVVIFMAIVSLVYLWQVSRNNGLFAVPINEPKKITYANQEYGFGFEYRRGLKLDTSDQQENYFKTGGKTIASISIPKGAYDKTNFSSGDITFAVKENTTQADCQLYLISANTTKKINQTVKIEPGTFYVDTLSGAAAGTAYKTEVYRMFKNGTCYEANLTVGIANIGNFEPGAVREVVEADIWNDLSCILVSLKFDVR